MTQQPLTASRRELWLPAGICGLLLVLEISLLVFDVAPGRPMPTGPPVAMLSQNVNSVRMRGADTLIWSDPNFEEGDPLLYRQDAIATMAESWAMIRFLEGTEISLDPDSMVVIEDVPERGKGQKLKLKLLRGKVRVKQTKQTPVTINEQVVEPTPNQAEVVVTAAPVATPPAVKVGTPTVRAKPKTEPPVKKTKPLGKPKIRQKFRDSSLNPINLGLSQALALVMNFVLPSANAEEAQGFLELSWDPIEGAKNYDLEIALDRAFKNRIAKKRIEVTRSDITLAQLAGADKAYYRVAAVAESGERGEFSDAIEILRKDFAPFPPAGPKRWNLDVAVGTTYQFREFRNSTTPSRIYGRGFSPLGFLLRSQYAVKTDWHLGAAAQLWLEALYPTTAHIQSGTYGVSHFDFLFQAQKRSGNYDWAAVLLTSHTFSVAWSGVTPVVTKQPILGLGIGLSPTLRAYRWISWNVILAGIFLGALGVELQASVRVPFSKQIRSAFESHNIFAEGYLLGRYLPTEEAAYGLGIRVGYGL